MQNDKATKQIMAKIICDLLDAIEDEHIDRSAREIQTCCKKYGLKNFNEIFELAEDKE